MSSRRSNRRIPDYASVATTKKTSKKTCHNSSYFVHVPKLNFSSPRSDNKLSDLIRFLCPEVPLIILKVLYLISLQIGAMPANLYSAEKEK